MSFEIRFYERSTRYIIKRQGAFNREIVTVFPRNFNNSSEWLGLHVIGLNRQSNLNDIQ